MSSVPLATVINVLSKLSNSIGVSFSSSGNTITLIKDGVPEVFDLPDMVPRKMLHRFQGRYGVKIEFFYHPEMM